MDGWMGGWVDGWMDGWMGGWMENFKTLNHYNLYYSILKHCGKQIQQPATHSLGSPTRRLCSHRQSTPDPTAR